MTSKRKRSATSESAGSVAFDQAVEYYDQTRALPPQIHAKVIELLTTELAGRGEALEVGVGTGRIAIDVQGRGIPMTGIDLSDAMLRKLISKPGGREIQVSVADGTQLPFRDSTFGGAIACHVLHLVSEWRVLVREMVRVVGEGVVLIEMGNWIMNDIGRTLYDRFCVEIGVSQLHRGLIDLEPLDEAMRDLGATRRDLPQIPHRASRSIRSMVDGSFRSNRSAATWSLAEEQRQSACDAVLAWAEREIGDLDEERHMDRPIRWFAFDV